MNQMSLIAICKEYGLSRRAIQGYEKEGLVKPTGRTNHGYLLYDEKTMHRILFIKYCQNIGFSIKEIGEFINEPKEVIKNKIKEQIPKLESNVNKYNQLINDSKKIVRLLNDKNCEELIFEITKKENM
ncbi:MAG: MerR family transcriptional regulator [Firmicutes bacterium]|nr:MerR family transcriptional regulator [Candidatus Colivicinus equi]